MKRLNSFIPNKFLVAFAMTAAVLATATVVNAWSPDRPTFTVQNPAPYTTFNSMTNNPNYGDERTFFDVKPSSNTSQGGFVDKQKVKDGDELLMRVYVHNNAADNLNGTNFNGAGVAKDTKARIFLPTASADALRANAYVSASNAKPVEVADTLDVYGDNKFKLDFVEGSARMYTNAVPSGFTLSDSIVGNGAPIGYTGANGVMPGCFQYTGIVTIKVKVKMETNDFTVAKQVSKIQEDGKYTWGENVTVKPGDTVAYQVRFTNTGNSQLDNVAIRDVLPKGMTIVPGSSVAKYGTDPAIKPVGNDAIVSNGGINIGSYASKGGAVVLFKAKVAGDSTACGKLTNVAEARVDGQATTDTADVTVECENKPVYSCDSLNLVVGDNRKISASVKVTAANGAVYKTTAFDFGDGTKLVTDKTTVEHIYAADGTYIVRAVPSFMVDGKLVTAESQACVKTVTFKAGEVVTPPTETPTVIPNTGAGSALGLFAGATIAGAFGHRLWMIRRNIS